VYRCKVQAGLHQERSRSCAGLVEYRLLSCYVYSEYLSAGAIKGATPGCGDRQKVGHSRARMREP
jgi:hypothetical protein